MEKRKTKPWPGFFVAIEGPDGVGKSTLVKELCKRFEAAQFALPSFTYLGPVLRASFSGEHQLQAWERLAMFTADRIACFHTQIKPALDDGRCVITDRYVLSNLIYQTVDLANEYEDAWLGPKNADLEWLRQSCWRSPSPDFTVILDLDPEVARERMAERGELDGYDANIERQRQVRRRFQCSYPRGRHSFVSVDCGPEELAERAARLLRMQMRDVGFTP